MATKYADPVPLGLASFGTTTILFNIWNAGFFELDAMLLGMALFVGGTAQVMAGIGAFVRGDTWGTTAFTMYGLYWYSYAALQMLPRMGNNGYAEVSASTFQGWYAIVFGIFTVFLAVPALKFTKATLVTLVSVTFVYFFIAFSNLTGNGTLMKMAGWVGLFAGSSALYNGMATLLNGEFGFVVLPVGGPTWVPTPKEINEPTNGPLAEP